MHVLDAVKEGTPVKIWVPRRAASTWRVSLAFPRLSRGCSICIMMHPEDAFDETPLTFRDSHSLSTPPETASCCGRRCRWGTPPGDADVTSFPQPSMEHQMRVRPSWDAVVARGGWREGEREGGMFAIEIAEKVVLDGEWKRRDRGPVRTRHGL